jgi:hypothetical protein
VWIEPPGLSKRGKFGTGALFAISIFGLFAIPLFFAVDAEMQNSDVYKLTMNRAQSSPCVTGIVGSPLKSGWMMAGSMRESSLEGSADFSIPVTGPKGKGSLTVRAEKLNGSWKIDSLIFTHGSSQSNLVPTGSSITCQ